MRTFICVILLIACKSLFPDVTAPPPIGEYTDFLLLLGILLAIINDLREGYSILEDTRD